jgi:rod shape-determining protein MreC
MKRNFFIILFVFLMAVVFLSSFFIKKERAFDENLRLKQENEELRAQIQKSQISNNDYSLIKVFSTYPFNIKNQITINAGEKQGIKKSAAVILKQDILVGQVVEVFENYSVVRTIFEPDWQLPVRIGKDEINALFQGGTEPKVNLIDKEKPLQVGDVVYSASREFPYGLKIGEISEIKETSAGVFKEAILKMPFNVNELREVSASK